MRVMLKLTLDCTPDAAWAAIRSPRVFRAVSSPFTTFTSLDPHGFPESWPTGEHRVLAKAFGLLPIGEQVISITTGTRGDTRLVHDDGYGLSGVLTSVKGWHHTMAVSPLPNGRTLYRDQLRFSGSPLLWPLYWAFWQWRAASMRRMAPAWR